MPSAPERLHVGSVGHVPGEDGWYSARDDFLRCLQDLLEALQVRGSPPLGQPGYQRFERSQRIELCDVDDLGKPDVLGAVRLHQTRLLDP